MGSARSAFRSATGRTAFRIAFVPFPPRFRGKASTTKLELRRRTFRGGSRPKALMEIALIDSMADLGDIVAVADVDISRDSREEDVNRGQRRL